MRHTVSFFTTPDSLSRKVAQDLKDLTKTPKVKKIKKDMPIVREGVINPAVFKLLDKKHIYMMYKLRNYYKNRNYMKRATFGCYGIFGIADVCIKDICSDVEDLRASMSDIFPDLDGTPERDYLNRPDYFRVNDFFKYKGYVIDGSCEIDLSININDYRLQITELAINWDDKTVQEAMKNLLIKKHIMLGPTKQICKVDSSIQDWIIGIFLPRESGEGMQSCQRFENFVLDAILLNDERIHTIVHSGITTGSMNLHYIMEVNASANDIWSDLVFKIHEACEKNSIIVNTKTSLVVDCLSELRYDCILEPQLNEYRLAERRELIKTVEKGMTRIDMENLALIPILKQLEEIRQEKIIEVHKNALQFMKDLHRFSHLKVELVSFLAGMILVDKFDRKEILDHYYSYLYLKLAGMIEAELRELLKEKIQKKLEKHAEPNYLKDSFDSLGIKAQNLNTISLGDCILGIINWNEKYPKDLIVTKEFGNNIKELQRNNVTTVRNMFAHCDYASNGKYAVPNAVEESLCAIINFIQENGYIFKDGDYGDALD